MKALELLKDYIEDENRLGDLNYAHYSNIIDYVNEAIAELEALEAKDRLAELEEVILDYYLAVGYQVGVGGWQFKINISTLYKDKEIQIMFKQDICSNWETVFRIDKQSTKEMFDAAFEYFSIKV